jgi:Integrase core domain
VLFFIEVGTRRVSLGGITRHPDSCWMEQVARNATMQDTGHLNGCRYLLHDRDTKFCREFRETLAACGVECTPIAARSPNLNAHAERWVRSIKEECLSKLILFGEKSLQRVVSNFLGHYHQERNHQGKDNLLLFPVSVPEAGSRGDQLSRAARLTQILQPGRMSIFTIVRPAKAGMFSGSQSHRGKSRNPVAWVACAEETKRMKPTDKAVLGTVSESPGRNESEPTGGLDKI